MSERWQVDDELIWWSPFTMEDMVVIYRGPYNSLESVVYDKKSGWQGVVKNELLRKLEVIDKENRP